MKKALLIISLLALALSACSESPEQIAERTKREQQRLDEDAQMKQMAATRKAIFKEEATFQDNCKAGKLMWIGERGWRSEVNAVICDGLPTRNIQYTVSSGKSTRQVSEVSVGESVDQVAAAKKILEEAEKKSAEESKARARAKALYKLDPADRKALGL